MKGHFAVPLNLFSYAPLGNYLGGLMMIHCPQLSEIFSRGRLELVARETGAENQ